MIQVKAIEVDGVLTPETNQDKGFGNHCDGENFLFFESEAEREKFYLTLTQEPI